MKPFAATGPPCHLLWRVSSTGPGGPSTTQHSISHGTFCTGSENLAKLILELCALGLGLTPETFCNVLNSDHSFVRLNYYRACPTPDLTLGHGAHSDFYTLTLLHQCQVGGLQVCKDGEWIPVKPRHGACVVIVGDNLHAWTNGRFQDIKHRVVLNDKMSRLSSCFSVAPSLETVISAPPEIVQGDERQNFKRYTGGEYLEFLKKRDNS